MNFRTGLPQNPNLEPCIPHHGAWQVSGVLGSNPHLMLLVDNPSHDLGSIVLVEPTPAHAGWALVLGQRLRCPWPFTDVQPTDRRGPEWSRSLGVALGQVATNLDQVATNDSNRKRVVVRQVAI